MYKLINSIVDTSIFIDMCSFISIEMIRIDYDLRNVLNNNWMMIVQKSFFANISIFLKFLPR